MENRALSPIFLWENSVKGIAKPGFLGDLRVLTPVLPLFCTKIANFINF